MPPPAHTPRSPAPVQKPPPQLPHELLDLVESISRRFNDLESYQLPQLAECRGPLTLHEQLAGDLRGEISSIRRDLEVRSPTLRDE
jgi:hypothetical protein